MGVELKNLKSGTGGTSVEQVGRSTCFEPYAVILYTFSLPLYIYNLK
jgi:hypothetical protein